MNVVIVNGLPGSGKTTFENICLDILEHTRFYYGFIYSSIDFVKEIAKKCGWDGGKDPKNRKFLSDLKDLLTEWNDVPFKQIQKKVSEIQDTIDYHRLYDENVFLFVDIREPKEIERAKKEFNAITVFVERPIEGKLELSNHADKGVFNYDYDIVVKNTGTIEELEVLSKTVLKAIQDLSKERKQLN